jgi:hypothetical protein
VCIPCNTDKYGSTLVRHHPGLPLAEDAVTRGTCTHAGCRPSKGAIISIMEPEQSTDKLDARLEEQGAALAKLQGSLAENKEASEELEKSLDELEAATQKLADRIKES